MTKDEALKLALEALDGLSEPYDVLKAQEAIKEALAQPEQEPVAWSYWQSCLNDDGTQTAPWVHRLSKFKPNESIINKDIVPLYTTPPQRTWVGLDWNEMPEIYMNDKAFEHGAQWAEAKLKEKNT